MVSSELLVEFNVKTVQARRMVEINKEIEKLFNRDTVSQTLSGYSTRSVDLKLDCKTLKFKK